MQNFTCHGTYCSKQTQVTLFNSLKLIFVVLKLHFMFYSLGCDKHCMLSVCQTMLDTRFTAQWDVSRIIHMRSSEGGHVIDKRTVQRIYVLQLVAKPRVS